MNSEPSVTSRDPAAFARAVRGIEWGKVYAQLHRFALNRCKRKEMAQDLAQEAVRRVIDSTISPWDPAKEPDPARLLMSIVNSLLANDRTSARATRNVPMTDTGRSGDEANRKVTRNLEFKDERAFSEETFTTNDLFARRLALLETRLADKPFALQVLAWMTEGHDTPAAICAVSGKTLEQVIAVRKLIHRQAEQVARDLDDEPAAEENDDDAPDSEEVA